MPNQRITAIARDRLLEYFVPHTVRPGSNQDRTARLVAVGGVISGISWFIAAIAVSILAPPDITSLLTSLVGVASIYTAFHLKRTGAIFVAAQLLLYAQLAGILAVFLMSGGPNTAPVVILPLMVLLAAVMLKPAAYKRFVGLAITVPVISAVVSHLMWRELPQSSAASAIPVFAVTAILGIIGIHILSQEYIHYYARESAREARNQRRFRLAVRSSGMGLWEWNSEEGRHHLDKTAMRFLGITTPHLTNDEVRAYLRENLSQLDRNRLRRELRRAYETGEESLVEVKITTQESRWITAYLSTIRNPRGETEQVVVALHDVSEAKLRDAQKSLFVATMSHELRTPLNGILGMADLMDGDDLPERYVRSINVIQRSGQQMLETINDVLDFARIEADALTVTSTDVNLRSLLATTLSVFSPQLVGRPVDLSSWVEPSIPDTLSTDPIRLKQIITNLVGNALKFTEEGSVSIHVTRNANELVLLVIDTGIGIPEEKLKSIFSPYKRVESARNRSSEGQGLGLAISRRLAELMGGSLDCASREQLGSTFTLILPGLAPPPPRPPRLEGRRIISLGLRGKSAEVIERIINAEGATLEKLDRLPEKITADILLLTSDLDLREALASRRKTTPALRIVAIYGGMQSRVPIALVDGSLSYPIAQEQLVKTLREVLETGRSTVQRRAPLEVLGQHQPMRIAVMEDDPINREVAVGLLKREGYQVDTAEDGRSAVALARANTYDLILMDLHMPEIDGLEATRRIRALNIKQPRIIAFTADITSDARESCLRAGFDSVLLKPTSRDALHEMLQVSYQAIHAAPHAEQPGPEPVSSTSES